MTPELSLLPDNAARRPMGEGHLTEEQFGELIAGPARNTVANTSPAEAHLHSCEPCTAELDNLRECLSLFREASTAYANNELRRMPQVSLPARRPLLFPMIEPAYWVAAAAIFLTALLPLQTLRRHAVEPAPVAATGAPSTSTSTSSESDEALLDEVSREESASLPASMQALADPTASATSTSSGVETSIQTSN